MATVKEEFNHIPKLEKELRYIKNHYIAIGIFSDAGEHPDAEINMVELARVHEFGATIKQGDSTIVIPERSFIRAGFDSKKKNINKQAEKLLTDVIMMKTTAKPAMESLGQVIVTQLQKYLTNLSQPPNAASTIAQKGSSNPLIDEGHLRDSIVYKVRSN